MAGDRAYRASDPPLRARDAVLTHHPLRFPPSLLPFSLLPFSLLSFFLFPSPPVQPKTLNPTWAAATVSYGRAQNLNPITGMSSK